MMPNSVTIKRGEIAMRDSTTTSLDFFWSSSKDAEPPSSRWSRSISTIIEVKLSTIHPFLLNASRSTGGYVKLLPHLSYLPVLIDSDNKPVYLFEFVDVINELLDYKKVKQHLPSLSIAQIDGAMLFLRKVAGLNSKGIDIESLEDEIDAEDGEFIDSLRKAFNDTETVRVLADV